MKAVNYYLPKLLFGLALLHFTVASSQTVIDQQSFESGLGIWISGGGNVGRSNTAGTAYDGSYSVRFNGNSNMTLTTTPALTSTIGYSKVDVKFFVRSSYIHASNVHSIALQYRPNILSSWTTVRTFNVGTEADDADRADINKADTYHAFYATLLPSVYSFGVTSQFQFVANITTGGTSRLFYLDNISIIGTTFVTPTNGPGGVNSGLETWLKADMVDGSGVVSDNSNVNTWKDKGRGHHASVIDPANTTLTNRPVYKNNATNNINFNPVVYFNNGASNTSEYTGLTNKAELNGTSGFYTQEQFVVVANDESPINAGTRLTSVYCGQTAANPWDRDTGGFAFGQFTSRLTNEIINFSLSTTGTPIGYGIGHCSATDSYTNLVGFLNGRTNTTNNGLEIYLNARNIETSEVGVSQFANYSNRRYWIGRSQVTDGSLKGRIAEIITYSARKDNTTERPKIESYLGIKYGITLGVNGVSQNYVNSSGTTIWNISTNTGFNYNITGIGRDDASQLNQKQSKSVNSSEIVTVGLSSIEATNSANANAFISDRNFLMWGSNNETALAKAAAPITIALAGGIVTTTNDILTRKWKFVEASAGDVPTVAVSIPSSALTSFGTLASTDAYVMVVADDANFSVKAETVFLTSSGSNWVGNYDFDGTKYVTFGVAHIKTSTSHLTFDGVDDCVRVDDVNELGSAFTIMTWIRPNGANTAANERTIVAKKADASSGYKLVLQTDYKVRMEWTVSGTTYSLTTTTTLPNTKWHNIAVIFNGTRMYIYIDGVLDTDRNFGTGPAVSKSTFSIGAQYVSKSVINNIFKGDIDELRIWNKSLTINELRFIMNQEIESNGSFTAGKIIPPSILLNEISTLSWSNLIAYYSMNNFIGSDIEDDSNHAKRGDLINTAVTTNMQTAPLPYVSASSTPWENTTAWTSGSLFDLPNAASIVNASIPIEWNIVSTSHNISSNSSKTVLGLLVNSNILSALGNSKIQISHYLKLDGKIDLVGQSQLIQTTNSSLAPTTTGSIEKDQQGTRNMYNYNFWSSPVSTINNSTVNNGYTIAGIMRDATDVNTIKPLQWTTSYDAPAIPTSPITISNAWLYKWDSPASAWAYLGQTGALAAGQGFTMKGPGSATTQNYTFLGKPNNGNVTNSVGSDKLNLSGNPYPSAIDAREFILDNLPATVSRPLATGALADGTLYFWQHSSTNATHIYAAYQGGYAYLNLAGGTPAVALNSSVGVGDATRAPKFFIPVGQSFLVQGSAAGGNITFKNSQRSFKPETDPDASTMFRTGANATSTQEVDASQIDNFTKIRIGFNTVNNFHRQLLIGFMNENATDAFDLGYDAINFDDNPSDMYFINGENNLIIQGVGEFSPFGIYPLGVKTEVNGIVQFTLDEVKNLDNSQDIFIYDLLTNQYYNLRNGNVNINLDEGTYTDRFSLRFSNAALGVEDPSFDTKIKVAYTNSNDVLTIYNNKSGLNIFSASVFNMLGQEIMHQNIEDGTSEKIQIPVKKFSAGTYIIKVNTDQNTITKKVIIR